MSAIKIGWAKRDISTNEPVNINGQMYLRISEGIHDPITVTALVMESGDPQNAAIFVACDITGFYSNICDVLREKIAEANPRIPVKNIVFNATHTHSSTITYKTPERSPDGKEIFPGETYRKFFVKQVCDAVCEAWEKRAPGGIAYGYGYAVVGHSRRTIYFKDQGVANPTAVAPNGHGVMYGNTRNPDFSHYEAGADHFLNVMFTVDADKKLTGMIINVPCPSQISEHFTKLSADYWNEVREEVAKEFGPDVYILPQCAAAGDLAPRILHYQKAQARRMELKHGLVYDFKNAGRYDPGYYNKVMAERRDIAERILLGVKDIYSWAMKEILTNVPVFHCAAEVPLTRRKITDEDKQWCEDNLKAMESLVPDPNNATPEEYRVAMSRFQSVRGRNNTALKRYEELKERPMSNYEIHVTRVGPIAFASNPFELYQDFMHRIQARSPFIQTFITQLAGRSGQYLPTVRGAYNKGYSASIFCNQVGPEGGQELVEYTLKTLNELKYEHKD